MSITGAAVVKRRSITGRFWGAPARADAAGCTSITGAADAERARTGAPAGICGAIAAGQAIHWGRRGLEQLKGLLSHVDPHLTLGQIVGRVVREAVERHDPTRPGRRAAGAPASGPMRRRRNFGAEGSRKVRRHVGATERRFLTEGRGLRTRPRYGNKATRCNDPSFGAEDAIGPGGAAAAPAGGAPSPAKASADWQAQARRTGEAA